MLDTRKSVNFIYFRGSGFTSRFTHSATLHPKLFISSACGDVCTICISGSNFPFVCVVLGGVGSCIIKDTQCCYSKRSRKTVTSLSIPNPFLPFFWRSLPPPRATTTDRLSLTAPRDIALGNFPAQRPLCCALSSCGASASPRDARHSCTPCSPTSAGPCTSTGADCGSEGTETPARTWDTGTGGAQARFEGPPLPARPAVATLDWRRRRVSAAKTSPRLWVARF